MTVKMRRWCSETWRCCEKITFPRWPEGWLGPAWRPRWAVRRRAKDGRCRAFVAAPSLTASAPWKAKFGGCGKSLMGRQGGRSPVRHWTGSWTTSRKSTTPSVAAACGWAPRRRKPLEDLILSLYNGMDSATHRPGAAAFLTLGTDIHDNQDYPRHRRHGHEAMG